MKIIIEPQNKIEELLVKILCREENEEVHRLYEHIANYAQPLWASLNGIQHKLYETDLYYADTVEGNQFIRISKNSLINIDFLTRVEPYSNHRMLAHMKNSEKLIIGRTYIPELKNIVKKGR